MSNPTLTNPGLPLGKQSEYPNKYAPAVLFPIARSESREMLAGPELPFSGTDVWNAWELTWLSTSNKPVIAVAEIRVPADSTFLIESKSLKLYLNSFAMSQFEGASSVEETIAADLGAAAGAPVRVRLFTTPESFTPVSVALPGTCIDTTEVDCDRWDVDAAILTADSANRVEEDLHTHLLRSLCPVTAQPDIGSVWVRYVGPKIDEASLLRYVVSFREHNDFHEACVERMFVDILTRCGAERLSVYARYQRRGGIDINPFRSNFETDPGNPRLWRQ